LNLATAIVVTVVAAAVVARHRRFSHHRRSPPQPLSHEISLMQMDSYHVSNFKFRYLKPNYAIS